MQRDDGGRDVVEETLDPADLARAGKEDQHVAWLGAQDITHHAGDRRLHPVLLPPGKVPGLHRVTASLAGHDPRAAQERRYRAALQGGRHDQQTQIRAQDALRLQRQCETEVGMNAPLVKLVEDDQSGSRQLPVRLEHAGENAFGHDLHSGLRAHPRVVPHSVADRPTDLFPEGLRHPARSRACRQPPRLQHHDPASSQPRLFQ
jgi:hypothetical protein